jgi:sugar/nucleoside kinase (ribokinase family)
MARILVVGSVARDEVIRLGTPFHAGTHMQDEWLGERLGGGASNTGVALARAGHETVIVSATGNDRVGRELLAELTANGIDSSQIITVEGTSTRSVVMIDPEGERTIVNLNRCQETKPPARLLNVAADSLYVRSWSPDLGPLLDAKMQSCRVIAHMPPCGDGVRPAHILVASQSDLEALMLNEPFEAGRRVAGNALEWVIVTRGENGATAYALDDHLSVPAPKVKAIDTTGAGDAFAAGLIHALVSGADMNQALTTACAWGAEATKWESSTLPIEAIKSLV